MKCEFLLSLALMLTMAGCGEKAPISDMTVSPAPTVSKSAESVHQETESMQNSVNEGSEPTEQNLSLFVNGTQLTVSWEDNESVQALSDLLIDGDITIEMDGYGGFEQVGGLPQSITRNDIQITTNAGDIVLYSGNSIVLFYGSNTWAYTKLGHIEGLSADELEELLSTDQTTVILSISQ